jgi:hypothetical protein
VLDRWMIPVLREPAGLAALDLLHAIHGTVLPSFLDRSVRAGENEIPTARPEPFLSLAVPCSMPQTCPKRLWVMSRFSTVPVRALPIQALRADQGMGHSPTGSRPGPSRAVTRGAVSKA